MNVQELIDELNKIEDKTQMVALPPTPPDYDGGNLKLVMLDKIDADSILFRADCCEHYYYDKEEVLDDLKEQDLTEEEIEEELEDFYTCICLRG